MKVICDISILFGCFMCYIMCSFDMIIIVVIILIMIMLMFVYVFGGVI